MTGLTPKLIVELRTNAIFIDNDQDRAIALALLDAYEAQRPRDASDSPDSNRPVCGWYWHPSAGWDVRAVAWHDGEWWDQHLCGLVESPVWWTEFPSWTSGRNEGGGE